MKILHGTLTETRFAFPEEDTQDQPMQVISEKSYKKDAVAYMADELGLHRVTNNGSDFAVSLHRKSSFDPSDPDTCPVADRRHSSVHTPQRSQGGLQHL